MLEQFRAVFAPPRDLILLVAAGWVGLALADRRAKQTAFGEKALDALVGATVLAFLVGGRMLYAAEHLSAFLSSPSSIISLDVGLFDAWAGLTSAVLAGTLVIQRKQLPSWQALDLLTPFFAALGIGLALSHLASGTAFGMETSAPWAIHLWGAQRHPTQVYELLAGVMTLGVILYYGARGRVPGKLFLLWLALAAGSRLLIEGIRGDSTLILGGLRLAQVVAWLVLAAALIGMEWVSRASTGRVLAAPAQDDMTKESLSIPPERNKKRRAAPGKRSIP